MTNRPISIMAADDIRIDDEIEYLKEQGKWTYCHEHGHSLPSVDDMLCRKCGADFTMDVKEIVEYAEKKNKEQNELSKM